MMFDDDFLNGAIPDITGDGKTNMLDAFLLNEMINDTEELEECAKLKKKQSANKSKKK